MKDEFGNEISQGEDPDHGVDEFGNKIIAKSASPEEIEAARPKSIGEIALTGAKNLAAGAAKIPTDMITGLGGLFGRLTDKLGITEGSREANKQFRDIAAQKIDKAMGAGQPGYELAQFAGNIAPQFMIPYEKSIPAASKALEAVNLPPWLAKFGANAGVNAGVGAVQGEQSGHPFLGASLGVGGALAGDAAKSMGGQVIKSYIKGGRTGAKEGLDEGLPYFINQEMGGSAHTMRNNAEQALNKLKASQDQIIASKGDLPIDMHSIFSDIKAHIHTPQFAANNLGNVKAAETQLNEAFDDYMRIAYPGHVPKNGSFNFATEDIPKTKDIQLKNSWGMKKSAQNDAVTLYRAANIGGDVKGMTKQGVSALLASKINDAIGKTAPEMNALNPEFSKLIPVAKALGRRETIAGQHNPIGLDELAALETGVNFMLHGNPAGMAIPIVQRMSKMPSMGQNLRRLGGVMQNPRAQVLPPWLAGAALNQLQPQEQQ